MVHVQNLLFRRDHFPVVLTESQGKRGKVWDFKRIEIPPYHPSMRKDGIKFTSVPDLLYGVVEATVRDLEEIADRRKDVHALLQRVVKDRGSGRILCEARVILQDDSGITFVDVPIVGRLYVGKREINPSGQGRDEGISIHTESSARFFNVPEGVVFPEELKREYKMTGEEVLCGQRRIECPNGWYRHNSQLINELFYRNVVMALDNAVVTEKYADQSK